MSTAVKNKRGQSLIEFVFVVIIFMNLLVVTFNAVLAFCVQQYFSYAAFLSARAFQAGNSSPQAQHDQAEAVLKKFLAGSSGSVSEFKLPNFNRVLASNIAYSLPQDPDNIPYRILPPVPGRQVEIQFDVPLFGLPFGELSVQFATMRLTAVSYLGRESNRNECLSYFQNFYNFYLPKDPQLKATGKPEVKNSWTSMDDNNC